MPLYLNYHGAYGHHIWQYGDLPVSGPNEIKGHKFLTGML